ncbi:MAG: type B 50S ribosomal protein L31 [Myxococcota bacterium]|nr:type B 50S ribosomal protein L31 [Myxococcota bacterium]
MREGIHPVLNPVVFIDAATGDEIVTRSATKSRETRDIEGVSHFVIKCDISCFSHPFYTGTQRLVDAEGRVDRFRRKYKRAQQKEE